MGIGLFLNEQNIGKRHIEDVFKSKVYHYLIPLEDIIKIFKTTH